MEKIYNKLSVVIALTNQKSFYSNKIILKLSVFMYLEKNAVATLSKLNLTALEAKVYLTLSRYEALTPEEIGKLTRISRPDIYRVTKGLHEKGLVEKILGRPIRIKATPAKIGLKLLLNQKKNEFEKLAEETDQLFSILEKPKLNNNKKIADEEFVLIPKRDTIINRINHSLTEAKETVDLILTFKRFLYGMNHGFKNSIEQAWSRGVLFRFILEKPEQGIDIEEPLEICRMSKMCYIRFFNSQPEVVLGLYDKKSVFIILNPQENVPMSPALWSNSPTLLAMAQDYFNVLWICAADERNALLEFKDFINEKNPINRETKRELARA